MKCLILLPILFGLISKAYARGYYYPNYSEKEGVKVVCADGQAKHIIELKAGSMQLKGDRADKYKYPKLAMSWPYGR